MPLLSPTAIQILAHPGAFARRVIARFSANQGLLLAGAVAYYALLSVVPLLILSVIVLSHWIAQDVLLGTMGRYLEWLLPGQSGAIIAELASFVQHRDVLGWVLLGTMLFFSSLAFSVLEKAMSVIFRHRTATRRRHYLVSAILPYLFVVLLGLVLLVVTVLASGLQALGENSLRLPGIDLSLRGVSGLLLYLLGFTGEVLLVAALYRLMPVGKLPWRHALAGAAAAALLWEVPRHVMVWYFGTLSQISVVYGSLTTAIIMLFILEIAATLLLLGAQVISEYEQMAAAQQ